jgi:hypothetical protein
MIGKQKVEPGWYESAKVLVVACGAAACLILATGTLFKLFA